MADTTPSYKEEASRCNHLSATTVKQVRHMVRECYGGKTCMTVMSLWEISRQLLPASLQDYCSDIRFSDMKKMFHLIIGTSNSNLLWSSSSHRSQSWIQTLSFQKPREHWTLCSAFEQKSLWNLKCFYSENFPASCLTLKTKVIPSLSVLPTSSV